MARPRRGALAAACALAGILQTGCFDSAELEEQAFLVTLGVDRSAGGLTVAAARVAVPSKLSGTGDSGTGSGGGDTRSGTPVVSASGRTLHEALALMNTGIERSINLSHLSAVIFGEDAARSGLLPYLSTLVRYREFRRTLYMFVAREPLSGVFTKDAPVLETSITRTIEDLHASSRRTGFAPSVQMHQFLGSIETPNEDPAAPILAVNRTVRRERKGTSGSISHLKADTLDYRPGSIDRAGGNPVECVGTAVFRGDRMVGELNGDESRYLQILTGELTRTTITLPAPRAPGSFLALSVRYAEPLMVQLDVHGRTPRLRIAQSFEADLMGDQAGAALSAFSNRRLIERALADTIKRAEGALIRKVFRRYRADPFRFFAYARGEFPTYEAMRAYRWHALLPRAQVEIDTEANLRRLGIQLNPPVNASRQGAFPPPLPRAGALRACGTR